MKSITPLNRRRVLKAVGAVGTFAAVPGTVSARADGEPPENAPQVEVSPWFGNEASVGHWIVHRLSFLFGYGDANPCRDTLEDAVDSAELFRETVDCEVTIDGNEIRNAEQYWGEPEQTTYQGDDVVMTEWRYATKPQPLDKEYRYEFRMNSWKVLAYDGQEDECNIESRGPFVLPPPHNEEEKGPENVTIVKRQKNK